MSIYRGLMIGGVIGILVGPALAPVFTSARGEENRAEILDRTGERWDVSQARTLGFDPQRFQYGIGRNAFTPLVASELTDPPADTPGRLRVIGVAEGDEAHAYSVDKLARHEIANTSIASRPIVVGY